jgi:hypothetical protein
VRSVSLAAVMHRLSTGSAQRIDHEARTSGVRRQHLSYQRRENLRETRSVNGPFGFAKICKCGMVHKPFLTGWSSIQAVFQLFKFRGPRTAKRNPPNFLRHDVVPRVAAHEMHAELKKLACYPQKDFFYSIRRRCQFLGLPARDARWVRASLTVRVPSIRSSIERRTRGAQTRLSASNP